MNKKGFTLTELLVVVVILGIIAGLSIPLIRNLTTTFEKRKYQSYADSVLQASKLYTDAYSSDLFGHNENGCCYVDYEKLSDKKLIEDIEIEGMSCNSSMTYVRVIKQGDKYGYKTFISCGKKKNGAAENISVTVPNTVDAKNYSECTCENTANLSVSADMTEAPKSVAKTKKKTKVIITSGTGINSNISIFAGWSKTPDDFNGVSFSKLDFKTQTPDDQQNVLLSGSTVEVRSQQYLYTPDGQGEYYLIARVDQLSDLDGNQWKNPDNIDSKYVVLGPFVIEEEEEEDSEIKLKINNPSNGEWTKNNITLGISVQAKNPIENFYSTFNANDKNWPVMSEGVGKTSFNKEYTGTQNRQLSVKVCDTKGNCDSKNTRIKIDQTPPTKPVITNPTYDSKTSTFKWAQSVTLTLASTDAHSGIYGYYYSYSNGTNQQYGDNPEENWVRIGGEGQNQITKVFEPAAGQELVKTVYIKTLDKARNVSQVSETTIKLDKKPPEKPTITNPKAGKWSSKAYNITITTSDSGSGVWRYYWAETSSVTSTSFKNWKVLNSKGCDNKTTCVDTFSADRNQNVPFMVCDVLKNCSAIVKSKVQIDKTKPTCSVSKSDTKTTSGVTVTVKCSDKGSGCTSSSSKHTGVKKKTPYTVKDNVGHTGSCTVSVSSYGCGTKKCTKYKYYCAKWSGQQSPPKYYNYGSSCYTNNSGATATCNKKCGNNGHLGTDARCVQGKWSGSKFTPGSKTGTDGACECCNKIGTKCTKSSYTKTCYK